MASGIEHRNLGPYSVFWRAPVAVLDRLKDDGQDWPVRHRLGRWLTPEGFDYFAIGQEALVATNGLARVSKFIPTNPEVIGERLAVMYAGQELFRRHLGDIAVATELSVTDSPYRWLWPAEDIIVHHQEQVEPVVGDANHHLRPDNERLRPADHPELARQVSQLAGFMADTLSGEHDLLPDIQGRGANLLLVRSLGAYGLRYVDMSPFVLPGGGRPPIHPLGRRERHNTERRLDQYEAWLAS